MQINKVIILMHYYANKQVIILMHYYANKQRYHTYALLCL